ncbi:MAG: helix-turn-helix domain-containing protein [Gemmatimonadota bacterium]
MAEPDSRSGGRDEPSLAEVALSAGYYDQPHMNREFRRMAGLTPGEYLRSRRFPESPHLAESVST